MSDDVLERIRDPQQVAADPFLSAFVTANAGSGKTKTLIDRVARLLLAGAEPATILCVTYTKAAASEMQRRLFARLGGWSVLSDEELRRELEGLEERRFDQRELSQARALFAKALETPGGLKIQTIHAFCEKLLRRFPLEAGISPGFRVMEEVAGAAAAAGARAMVARHALNARDAVADAYARFAVALDFGAFESMFDEFEDRRGALAAFFDKHGGLEAAAAWIWRAVGLAPEETVEIVSRDAMGRLDRNLWARAAETLRAGSATDNKCAEQLAKVAADPEATLEQALRPFFTDKGEGEEAKWVQNAKVMKANPSLQALLLAEQARLYNARLRLRAARVAAETLDALTLAYAYLAAYRVEKALSGSLDFADLIEKTRELLRSRPAAAWVLYKLDGGIDHILVDEAQDTAPDQWAIVDALSEEFFAGAGVRQRGRLERNVFVVGDPKQSIYSFQGAQPELLARKSEFHRDRATGAGFRFEQVDLLTSWRSTPQVLSFVDAVFSPPHLAEAIQSRADAPAVKHVAAKPREKHAGCVDVWPLMFEQKGAERDAWDAPLDAEPEQSANRRLARQIACEIRDLIARGDAVYDRDAGGWRPANAGDVIILVRRRKALFEEILRALKHEDIPVAGADRLALSEHIVFDDLVALAHFALFPDDELTLAALLKSPFCGLTDDDVYALAYRREQPLWRALQACAGEQASWREALTLLEHARSLASEAQPFEFYARILGRIGSDGQSMRQRLLTRLGGEAEDALDEFLAQVLAAEGRGAHDLESLAADFANLDITVKRELDAPAGEVRVMTAHGAKGLEAPIVFLPETTVARTGKGSPLMETDDGGFLWCTSKDKDCEASAAARQRRQKKDDDEVYRLLYVALTRARDRLVLCGRASATAKEENIEGWWGAVARALEHEAVAPQVRAIRCGEMEIRRFGPDPIALGPAQAEAPARDASLPAWAQQAAPTDPLARYSSPSDLGEGARAPAPSPLAEASGLGRFRRGDLIHRLLQILPDLPAPDRADGAAKLLGRERDLADAQRAEMTAAALAVLSDPQFAGVFGPGSRAEVAIAGTAAKLPGGLNISGRIDRLVVLPDRVLVVDFKTNRPSPARIEDADPAYLRQMAVYAAVLEEIFPGRRVEAALVWTDGPKLMPVPENLLAQTLAQLGRTG